ncbi:MAG TPA: oligosaccharide flippase family protein [Solirubrobacteraceae bacterium]
MSPAAAVDSDVLDTPAAGGMVVRGSALRFGSYASVIALSVVSAAVLTRHLGRVSFGQYTTVISLAAVVSSVTDAGMSALGTREYAMRSGAERDALMRDLLGLRVALTLIGVLIATAFALIAGYPPALLAGTALAALAVVVMVFQHTLSIPLTTRLRLGYLSGLEVARQAVTGVLLVGLVLLGAGVLPLLAVALVANLLLLPPTAALVRGEISMRMSIRPRRWVKLLRLTVAFSLASAANTIYLFTAQIITSLVASGVQSGLFAASFRIFIALAAIPGILVTVSLPVLARAARDDRARLSYALQRTFEASMLVGMAAAIAVIGGARFMIAVVAGPEYAAAADALRIEGGVLLASFVLAGWGFGLLALHRHRAMLLANLAALAVSSILTVILARADGARGAALASVCGETTLALLYLVGLIRGSPELRPELGAAAKIVLAAIPALAVALLPGIAQLLQPIAALAVFAVLIVLMRAVPREVYELIPPRLRRAP